jgi:hypothetical protein
LFLEGKTKFPGGQVWSTVWLVMILAQIGLGAWTIWSNKAADVATAHGPRRAFPLAGALLSFRLSRCTNPAFHFARWTKSAFD